MDAKIIVICKRPMPKRTDTMMKRVKQTYITSFAILASSSFSSLSSFSMKTHLLESIEPATISKSTTIAPAASVTPATVGGTVAPARIRIAP